MIKLRCIAVDDEPLALRQISTYIGQTPFLELLAACKDAFEVMKNIHEHSPDLLFVDINMPGMNGLELVKALDGGCMVVFTTAYDQYALEGFRVDAVDYLVKPIGYPDFLKAANKAKKAYDAKTISEGAFADNDENLFVKSEYRIIRIRFSEIKYIESMREYVRIHLSDGKAIMTLLSMKALEDKLPAPKFMRVHRSFIVNLHKINVIERNRIVFDKDVYIPIGEQYKEKFQQYIERNFI